VLSAMPLRSAGRAVLSAMPLRSAGRAVLSAMPLRSAGRAVLSAMPLRSAGRTPPDPLTSHMELNYRHSSTMRITPTSIQRTRDCAPKRS
jgi:hypothetical protein